MAAQHPFIRNCKKKKRRDIFSKYKAVGYVVFNIQKMVT
jgi:hypothetical protein